MKEIPTRLDDYRPVRENVHYQEDIGMIVPIIIYHLVLLIEIVRFREVTVEVMVVILTTFNGTVQVIELINFYLVVV